MSYVVRIGYCVVRVATVLGVATELCLGAAGLLTSEAVDALATGGVEPDDADAVAFLDGLDVLADAGDEAYAFVAGDEGGCGLNGPVAFCCVQVGMTDAAGFHLDLNLFGAGLRDGHLLDDEGLAELTYDCGFHCLCHFEFLSVLRIVCGSVGSRFWVALSALILWGRPYRGATPQGGIERASGPLTLGDRTVGLRPTLVWDGPPALYGWWRASGARAPDSADTGTASGAPFVKTLEEAEGLGAVAHQEVLGLAIVIEDHLVGLAAETRLLVAAEGCAGRIQVIAVGPDATSLDAAAETIGVRAVAGPDTRAETVGGVVRDLERFFDGLELGDREDWSEDLFLEDAHLVVAGEDGGLNVVAIGQITFEVKLLAAGEALCAFCFTDGDVLEDLLLLILRGLWAHLRGWVERVANLDLGDTRYGAFDELVEDGLVHEGTRGAGADLALVEGEEGKAFDGLVEEVIILVHDVGHEDVGGFSTQLQGLRNDGLGCVLHDEAAGRCFSGEGDLGDAGVAGECFADFAAGAGHNVDHACGHDVGDERDEGQEAEGCVRGRLDDGAVACSDCRGDLPCGHQQGEVPGDDLADYAHGLFEVVGDGVLVDLAGSALFGANTGGEVAEVVDG